MSVWQIETYNEGTSEWEDAGSIPRPNDNMSEPLDSNLIEAKLTDGSSGYVIPSVKFQAKEIQMAWVYQSKSFKEQLEDLIKNTRIIRITTHVAGKYLIGRFTQIDPPWLVGRDPQDYNITATFKPMVIS